MATRIDWQRKMGARESAAYVDTLTAEGFSYRSERGLSLWSHDDGREVEFAPESPRTARVTHFSRIEN